MTSESIRLDKWLWQARFFKTRSRAARTCAAHPVRINGEVVSKSHATVKPGDVLTFPLRSDIRVIEVLALGGVAAPRPRRKACMTTCRRRK